jgi:hypothetical protein
MQRLAGWAEALYQIQREILAPNSGTRHNVQRVLRHEIRCLATGDLGTLVWRRPPVRPPRRVTLRRQAIATVRAFVVAALPLAAVLAAQPVLHLSAPVFSWARITAGIWALLHVVIALDPAIGDKIDTARTLVGTLRDSQSLSPPNPRGAWGQGADMATPRDPGRYRLTLGTVIEPDNDLRREGRLTCASYIRAPVGRDR